MSAPDPSTSSYYVSDDFYAALIEDFSGWQTPERAISDDALGGSCARFLAEEARLLDEDRFDDWLDLFSPECVYWVPGTRHGDPRREIAIAFDDRRRLEDRIFRLKTGEAWSQRPRSRTTRMVSNIEPFATADPDIVMVRSNFLTVEFRAGETRIWGGWTGHRLRDATTHWKILVKQVNLIDCDQNLRNPSIVL